MNTFDFCFKGLVHKTVLLHHWNPFKRCARDGNSIEWPTAPCVTNESTRTVSMTDSHGMHRLRQGRGLNVEQTLPRTSCLQCIAPSLPPETSVPFVLSDTAHQRRHNANRYSLHRTFSFDTRPHHVLARPPSYGALPRLITVLRTQHTAPPTHHAQPSLLFKQATRYCQS